MKVLLLSLLLLIGWKPEYAQVSPEVRQWFNSLTNANGGNCCAVADGARIEDPNWEIMDDPSVPYRVMLNGKWYDVAREAVVPGSNKVGYAIAWPVQQNGQTFIRCFLPGTGV